MSLKLIHEAFIERANRPMDFGKLPIKASKPDVPLIAVNRWRKIDGTLTKTYTFRRPGDRVSFVSSLMSYEEYVQHNAVITIDGESVTLVLSTHDVNDVTELDKEYAAHADLSFKDIVYSTGDSIPLETDDGVL